MNLNFFTYFQHVAHTCHFTSSAKALYVSQPSISHGIKQLEDYFGVTLFKRQHKKLTLTKEGEILLYYIQRINTYLHAAKYTLHQLQKEKSHY